MNLIRLNMIGITILLSEVVISAFIVSSPLKNKNKRLLVNPLSMSFVADGSDYSSTDSDYESEDDGSGMSNQDSKSAGFRPLAVDEPAIEESPVSLSKNSANRFIVFYYDKDIDTLEREDVMELHDDRVECTEDHVLYCRKANLYNDTFNYNSMTDVVWSYPLLSTDLKRYVGHAMCLDSMSLQHVQEFISNEPNIQRLTGGDISNISLFRWRHLKDHTLRRDMGRHGVPNLLINIHRTDHDQLRADTNTSHIQYLIQSERVIEAGPLHIATKDKNDPDSIPIGNLILFNAYERDEAIQFAENDPCALAGLYDTMRLHNFNVLDISGKFVVMNRYSDDIDEMKEALEYWGYPVRDDQTPWINA